MAHFLDALDRDALGVDPQPAARLHPEMLDAAEAVLTNDLRRIRYAGAPPPLGTQEAEGAGDRASTPSEPSLRTDSPGGSTVVSPAPDGGSPMLDLPTMAAGPDDDALSLAATASPEAPIAGLPAVT